MNRLFLYLAYTLLILNDVPRYIFFHICKTRDIDVKKHGFRNANKKVCYENQANGASMQTAGPADGSKI